MFLRLPLIGYLMRMNTHQTITNSFTKTSFKHYILSFDSIHYIRLSTNICHFQSVYNQHGRPVQRETPIHRQYRRTYNSLEYLLQLGKYATEQSSNLGSTPLLHTLRVSVGGKCKMKSDDSVFTRANVFSRYLCKKRTHTKDQCFRNLLC